MIGYTKDTGYLIGLLAGDGSIVTNTVYLANVDKSIIAEYKRICEGFTHNSMRTYENPHEFKGFQCYSESHRFYAPELASFILENIGGGAFNKRVPEPNGDIQFTQGILSGIWDSDGSVTINRARANKGQRVQGQVSLTSRSKLMVDSVGVHLKVLGCDFSIYTYSKEDKPLYILNIIGASIPTFRDNVSLKHETRKVLLEEITQLVITNKVRNMTKVPITIDECNNFIALIKTSSNHRELVRFRPALRDAKVRGNITKDMLGKLKSTLVDSSGEAILVS